ncbi:hypothetical protein HMI54_007255, partial [Coelomomyces lativittatus]
MVYIGMEMVPNSLAEEIQIARECAVLGSYDMAIVYYEAIIKGLTHQASHSSEYPLHVWMNVKSEVETEKKLVQYIVYVLSELQKPVPEKKQVELIFPKSERSVSPTRDPDVWSPPPPKSIGFSRRHSAPKTSKKGSDTDSDEGLPAWAKTSKSMTPSKKKS